MTYESTQSVTSAIDPAVTYTVAKMSFARRTDLMRRIRELARQAEFLEASQDSGGQMDAALLQLEIDRVLYGAFARSRSPRDRWPSRHAGAAGFGRAGGALP